MDFGAVCAGYHSDITRTICVGRADARQRELYDAVLSAQQRALSAIWPGVTGVEVDCIARETLREKNLEQYFGHGPDSDGEQHADKGNDPVDRQLRPGYTEWICARH